MSAAYDLADGVAPGLGDVGVMLPSAPLHHLLVRGAEVYVATSGNLAGEPLRYRNAEALADLGGVVDAFLLHDRPIHVPVEDSVLLADAAPPHRSPESWGPAGTASRQTGPLADAAPSLPIRRSRGYAPLPIMLGEADAAVLAVGGELKNTFAVTRDGMAFLSAHIGDMESPLAQSALTRSVEQMSAIHGRVPELVVADLHPDYAVTRWAERYCEARDLPLIQVQHHQAHALSLLAEHGLGPEIRACVATFDGVGYGLDGHIWGGEILVLGGTADPLSFERAWHLDEYWLPGGDAASFAPWKCAVALLDQFSLDGAGLPPFAAAPQPELNVLRQLPAAAAAGLPGLIHHTTSAGRLFDAVASILAVRHRVTYEAQAAMELERLARDCVHPDCAAWRADPLGPAGPAAALSGPAAPARLPGGRVGARAQPPSAISPVRMLLAATVAGLQNGVDRACLARRFHSTLAGITATALVRAADQAGAEVLGLTGGVFQNRLLTRATLDALAPDGRPVLTHRLVPAGDGGLALGQARAGYTLLTWNPEQGR
jgi:hydrogenase maturation protein HypF